MPTIIRENGFEIRIYTDDHEPPHVHIYKSGKRAKMTLQPVVVIATEMNMKQTKQVELLVYKHLDKLLEAWKFYNG